MADPTWYTADTARSELAIVVTGKGLAVAQEQCLQRLGLPLTLTVPPSESFAQGVVYQALANKQATQADTTDEYGSTQGGVRLYPFDKKIMSMLIVPSPVVDDEGTATGDNGRVRSLIG